MNKSKFLKRSLAALLAILMVATMIPSVFAAGEDAPEIFVDNRRTTYDGDNKYSITIYDTDDVLISWTPIPGTKMRVVTKDGIDKDLDARIYLPENANLVSSDEYKTYSLKLQKLENKKDPVDYNLSITIKSTKPTNECRLGGVRVDKTSGWYELGYLGGTRADANVAIPGYSKAVTNKGFAAHAIEGVVNDSTNTVTITLPFGMTPENVGFDANATTSIQSTDTIKATAVFAPLSIAAKSKYTYFPGTKTGEVTVTAQSGATRTYKVKFVSEQVFESFTNATNLKDLENVTKIKNPTSPAVGEAWAKYTLNVNVAVAGLDDVDNALTWVPEFETTERAQRIMGVGYETVNNNTGIALKLQKKTAATTIGTDVEVVTNADTNIAGDSMLRIISSKHATWTKPAMGNTYTAADPDYVYFLIRTKANPSGAYVEIKLNPVKAADPVPRILEVQAANTMSSESAAFVAADAKSINVMLSKEYSDNAGGSETDGDKTDISKVYLHITTSHNAIVRIPSQEENETPVWSSSYDGGVKTTRHLLKNVNAKDKSVDVVVTDVNGKNPRTYTINFTVATTNHTELGRVALYEKVATYDGTYCTFIKVAESLKQAEKTAPRELEIPYEYFTTDGNIDQHPDQTVAGRLAGLYLFIEPSEGASVAPGTAPTQVNVTNVEVDSSKNHAHNATPDASLTPDPNIASGNIPHIIENGATTLDEVWTSNFVKDSDGLVGDSFEDTLYITVDNAGDGTNHETYKIKLKRKHPRTEAEIASAETNRALDDDYIYAQANTLGNEKKQLANVTNDLGQAYIGAKDEKGNDLPARIEGNDIIVTVPASWDESADSLYLTDLKKTDDTQKVYRYVYSNQAETTKAIQTVGDDASVLKDKDQRDQTQCRDNPFAPYMNRFKNLTVVGGGAEEQNILWAVSEKDYYEQNFATSVEGGLGSFTNVKTYGTPYEVHIEYAADDSEERGLKNVQSANPALATAEFDETYGLIKVTVPESTDWADGYRGDRSKNFKLNFTTSNGALVIDKYQKELNDKLANTGSNTANANNANWAGTNSTGRYKIAGSAATLPTPDEAKILNKYRFQLNERDQITSDTEFFVLNGELYIYDPLTGDEIPVTGMGGKFTNNNWATIKTKQAEIQVYDAEQNDKITYRLDLEIGDSKPVSGDNTLASVTADGHAATKSGNDYTVYVPEGTDMSKAKLSLRTTDSGASITSVDGKTYTDGMEVDLSEGKTVTVVVTAANGASATYTVKSEVGTAPTPWTNPYTDVKDGDWFYDAVKYVNQNGLMEGTSANKFSPRSDLTRGMFAQILYNAAGKPSVTWTNKFSDVKEGDWYASAIIWAADQGVLAGYGNGTARPKSSITREDLVSLLWRYEGSPAPTSTTLNFSDASKVSSYAKDAMLWAVENDIVTGTSGKLNPQGNAMRSEAAQMLMKYFSNK